jgi:hypothetical protein
MKSYWVTHAILKVQVKIVIPRINKFSLLNGDSLMGLHVMHSRFSEERPL